MNIFLDKLINGKIIIMIINNFCSSGRINFIRVSSLFKRII